MSKTSSLNKMNFKFKKISDLCIGMLYTIIALAVIIIIKRVFFELFEFNIGTELLNESESCMTETFSFCKLKDDYQFDKFIKIYVDDISLTRIDELNRLFYNNSHEYAIYCNTIKNSHELIKTTFTGRDNNKINIKMIEVDSFFTSFNRRYGKKIHIFGASSSLAKSLLFVHDVFYEEDNFKDLYLLEQEQKLPLLMTSENQSNFLNHITELSKSNDSFILFINNSKYVQYNEGSQSVVCILFKKK